MHHMTWNINFHIMLSKVGLIITLIKNSIILFHHAMLYFYVLLIFIIQIHCILVSYVLISSLGVFLYANRSKNVHIILCEQTQRVLLFKLSQKASHLLGKCGICHLQWKYNNGKGFILNHKRKGLDFCLSYFILGKEIESICVIQYWLCLKGSFLKLFNQVEDVKMFLNLVIKVSKHSEKYVEWYNEPHVSSTIQQLPMVYIIFHCFSYCLSSLF